MVMQQRATPKHRSWVVLLAVLVAVLGAIVPTVSHGLMRSANAALVEICTSLGPHWVSLPASPDSPDTLTHGEHCLFCLLATNPVVPLRNAAFQDLDAPGEGAKAIVGQVRQFNDRSKAIPQPRGPPRD